MAEGTKRGGKINLEEHGFSRVPKKQPTDLALWFHPQYGEMSYRDARTFIWNMKGDK
jgi:hypothetical protein